MADHLKKSDLFKVVGIVGVLGLALWQEQRKPLRTSRATQKNKDRLTTSLAFALLAGATLRVFPWPRKAAVYAAKHRLGIMNTTSFSKGIKFVVSFLLLDYQLYLSHRWSHEISFNWRFHQTHHSDLELTTLTSLRFHSIDLLLSNLFQTFWVLFWGISPKHLSIFEVLSIHFAQLHHANVRLGNLTESLLQKIFITPRLHTIHHSVIAAERNSNYGIVFSFWDRLHKTFKLVPTENTKIGLAQVNTQQEARFLPALLLPFSSGLKE